MQNKNIFELINSLLLVRLKIWVVFHRLEQQYQSIEIQGYYVLSREYTLLGHIRAQGVLQYHLIEVPCFKPILVKEARLTVVGLMAA